MTEKEFQSVVEEQAYWCARVLIDKKLIKRPKLFMRMLVIQTKKIHRSWGGLTRPDKRGTRRPRISISKKYIGATGLFHEYQSFADDPEIGSFESENGIDHIRAVVSHEISHAATFWSDDRRRGQVHGPDWKSRYRILRREIGLVKAR